MPGSYVRARYETDSGQIHPCRVQPESIIATINPLPAGQVTNEGSVNMTPSRRRNGISARYVTLTWNEGATPPTGYKPGGFLRLSILTPTAYQSLVTGQTFQYQGSTVVVVGKNPEKIR